MFRSLLAGTYTAVVMGTGTAILASAVWGTAGLPFVVGSSVGFALGSLRWYWSAQTASLLDLRRYPSLMRLHLLSNFPYDPAFSRHGIEWYTPSRFGSWAMRSKLVVAWLAAQPAIENVQAKTETEIVDGYTADDYMMERQDGEMK